MVAAWKSVGDVSLTEIGYRGSKCRRESLKHTYITPRGVRRRTIGPSQPVGLRIGLRNLNQRFRNSAIIPVVY